MVRPSGRRRDPGSAPWFITSSATSNPDHDAFIKQCALQLWANAQMLEGTLVEPQDTVNRIQTFLEEAAEKRSPILF